MSVDSLVKYWVCMNGCDTTPNMNPIIDINTADNCFPIHYIYEGGLDSSTVEFYKISSGGHQVPSEAVTQDEYGLGNRNMDIDASKEIWRFFSKYSLATATDISENESPKKEIAVYPNPSTGIFYIEF